MKRSYLLPAAYLFDRLAGDPDWFPHPVRAMGWTIARGEIALRRTTDGSIRELASGTFLTLAVVGASYWITSRTIAAASRRSPHLGDAVELLLGWTCLAARNLEQEAAAVTTALEAGNLHRARGRLARIVGRDTDHLNEQEVSRAVIETVAESASDGIVAPLFYMALGGAPLAMAYKAVNTLDSMIGHADARYFFFGKSAARLDDVANLLPSRLTALCLAAAAVLTDNTDPRAALRVWSRDGSKHKSPNAGQPESAMSGALHVRLGGENTYTGEPILSPTIGREFPAPSHEDAATAILLTGATAVLAVATLTAALLFLNWSQSGRRRTEPA